MKNENQEDEDCDIFKLISKLRQEKLFIKSEKVDIQELNELIRNKTHTVIKASWLTNKQRLLLFERKVNCQNCQKFDFLYSSDFVEAKHILGFQNAVKISNLLHILRAQPKQLAKWLIIGETLTEDSIQYPLILQGVLNGLYGGCIFADDTKLLLTLLYELAKQQLLKSDNPRRIIKQGTCSFRHLYFLFHEVYHPAKFFLSAALEMPIMEVLCFSDYYLDIDHDKTIMRFRQDDNLKMYKDAVEYRNEVVARLSQFTNNFIQSLLENAFSFPKAIAWIACHIYKMIEKSFCAKEANAITTELIFILFICPVIVDPEQYGIFNSQMTEIGRHNLIQIGKILQILALYKFEGIDKKYMDIFQNIDKNCMSHFIELLFFDMDSSEPPIENSPQILRDIMLFTEDELNNLICFLQKVQIMRLENDNLEFEKNASLSVSIEEHLSSLTISSRDTSPKSSRPNGEVNDFGTGNASNPKKTAFFSIGPLGAKNQNGRPLSENKKPNTVVVFPIDGVIYEPIGLLSEDKVIDLSVPPVKNVDSGVFEATSDVAVGKENLSIDANGATNGDAKGNYSGYADEGSIGNTSDNLEAISEAASNHSVASSLELENEDQNDNLSDMVSANVSGRGTPNISGRDTPSSQVNENDDPEPRLNPEPRGSGGEAALPHQPPQPISRQIRSEIDDKFCKFEIKKLLEGDETISIISETWSTDVLASDNEAADTGSEPVARGEQRVHLQLVDQAIQELPLAESALDISETQSESAWSTDVAASACSDTEQRERLTEVDNDDAASVAQSDDAHSVARSDDTRSETDDAASARRLSNCSSSYGGAGAGTGVGGGGSGSGSGSQSYVANVAVTGSYVSVSVNSPNYTSSNTSFMSSSTTTFKPPTESPNFVSINQNYVTSATFQEFKKLDNAPLMNGKVGVDTVDTNANNVFKSIAQTVSQSIQTATVQFTGVRDGLFPVKVQNGQQQSDLSNVAGPSGLNKVSILDTDNDQNYIKQNSIMKKYGDRPTEILLSNCSLNSSSSGSSSNSFENKNSVNENSDQWETKPWLNSSGSSLNVTLTPSESTSELSVLSVNNLSNNMTGSLVNPSGAIKKNLANRSLKPSASTGAIPKSISFDMSVDKGLDDDSRSKRGGFFGKLKNGFRYKKRSFRNQEDLRNADGDDFVSKRGINDSPVRANSNCTDASDDILAKYRTKPYAESSPVKENGVTATKKMPKNQNNDNLNTETNSFSDIKKKLRLVLENTSEIPCYFKRNPCSIKTKLETVLRLELGRSRKLREWSLVARISEAIRCVNLLDDKSCLKLFQSMKADVLLRSTYIQYLITSKQELLFSEMYLNTLHEQIKHDRYQCEIYFAALCVREFLSEQEPIILLFCDEFRQLSLADEKYDILQNFYHKLYSIMNESKHWQDVLHKRGSLIKVTLERYIIGRVYNNAIYPNGDGDRDRDKVLHDHIENLSKIITPGHKDLLIPKAYLRERPWVPAQDALRALNIARTPKDKLKCVLRCANCIMDLLALSQTGGSATADDFTPVLVYVIIKVNPEALLSTIQFVNSFQGSQIGGEEAYWWTQFCSAVEYIKTMDYSD